MTHQDIHLSRRTLLKGAASLVIAVHLPFGLAWAQDKTRPFAPNAFVRVGTDDTVTVLIKHIEFGQGPFTGLTTLVAEEMDADWSQMRAEHAPSNPALYKNLFFSTPEMPFQGTGGSTAIANSYEQMRKAGAAARAMLVAAAAQAWNVAASEITVERGTLHHVATGRQGRFGEFAEAAGHLPVPQDPPLKEPSAFRFIGKDRSVNKLDSTAKSTGKAQFTIDINEPNMLTVVVAHPPRFGARVAAFETAAARAVRGVVDVKQIPSGIAVYAEATWPALKGREKLEITWNESSAESRGSEQIIEEYRELARKPGVVASSHGDIDATLARGSRVIEAEYVFPYLVHAPMEPLDGFLSFDGKNAVARFGSQSQTFDHMTIAGILGLKPDQVELETMFAGGSFGRRAQSDSHFAAELAHVAKAIGPGRPVKLIWTREDDIQGGYYRSIFVHRLRGVLEGDGIVGWSNTVVGQSIGKGTPLEAMIVKDGIDATSVEGAREIPYDIANFRCDLHTTDVRVPVLWWRSVGHTHTGYAVECFIDELLEAMGKDPVEGRLAMMSKAPRPADALRAVAELAKWSGPGPHGDRARGVAVVESFGSFIAQIAEVSAGNGNGPRVHKVWCAVDCGVAVNPDVIRAQMEGGIGFGLGHALYGELTLDQGRPVQANFDTYRALRIHEMPQVEVFIVPSSEKPTGVGEPGVPPIGPAVANAMARLGLGRPRRLPLVRGMV
jgi:isoquinoline 1-oxidoreductase beta subunit